MKVEMVSSSAGNGGSSKRGAGWSLAAMTVVDAGRRNDEMDRSGLVAQCEMDLQADLFSSLQDG